MNNRIEITNENLLTEEQCLGFTVDGIDNAFGINQVTEQHREFNIETHVAFVDFEKL